MVSYIICRKEIIKDDFLDLEYKRNKQFIKLENMKVLFVLPKNQLSFFGYFRESLSFPHLGVAYLISLLSQNNIEVSLFDDNSTKNDDELLHFINRFNPSLIGVTAYTPTRRNSYKIINCIKKELNIPVVLGGPHVSSFRKSVFDETKCDFAIKNEGEFTLLELIKSLDSKSTDFSEIKGLIWRDGGEIIENEDRPFIRDLDSLPFPNFDLFDIKEHLSYGRKIISIITSRGCPFNCNFCAAKLSMGQCFRARKAEDIFNELVYQVEKGYSQFDFNDDCFSFDLKRAEEVLDRIISSKIDIKFQFISGLRVDRVNRTLLSKLKQAGCYYIAYGCESGNEQILKEISKKITLDQVREAVKLTSEAGIVNVVYFIIGNKNETYAQALDSIKFAKSLNTLVNFRHLIPHPGTEVFDWIQENGRFLVEQDIYLNMFSLESTEPFFETKEFSRKERKRVLKKGFALHNLMLMRCRFGDKLGYVLYLLIRIKLIKKILSRFVFSTKLGKCIAVFLSRKSYSATKK